ALSWADQNRAMAASPMRAAACVLSTTSVSSTAQVRSSDSPGARRATSSGSGRARGLSGTGASLRSRHDSGDPPALVAQRHGAVAEAAVDVRDFGSDAGGQVAQQESRHIA